MINRQFWLYLKICRERIYRFEIAESYKSLIREQGLTQTELALKVGKSQASVANKIRLLKLPPACEKINKRLRPYGTSRESFAVA